MPPLLQPGDPLDDDYNARATRAQCELLSNALERFRKRWHNGYLLSLREKHYNRCAENPTHHLSVGKLVMVRHDNVHRIEWPLGVITAIYPDKRRVYKDCRGGGVWETVSLTSIVSSSFGAILSS